MKIKYCECCGCHYDPGGLCQGCRIHNDKRVAEVEKRERYLKKALEDIAKWRAGCWEYDEDVGREKRDFSDEESWEMVEGSAAGALTKAYPPQNESPKERKVTRDRKHS